MPPDFIVISAVINIREIEKQVALDRAGRAQSAVARRAPRSSAARRLTVTSVDAPLTWATQLVRRAARRGMGRAQGAAPRRLAGARARERHAARPHESDDLVAALAAIDDSNVHHVQWQVDARNPSWPLVRAAAIEDAIAKARDYAAALRGSITALVHVADEGLLGGQDSQGRFAARAHSAGGVAEFAAAPRLDPAPQEIGPSSKPGSKRGSQAL